MEGKVVGKEFIYEGNRLEKSQFYLPVIDVLAEKRRDEEAYDIFAITKHGKEQIGLVTREINWVGSRDFEWMDSGPGRVFYSTEAGQSITADIQEFKEHWKGTKIFINPGLPSHETEAGDVRFIGGDSVLIKSWLQQSDIWMKFALDASRNTHILYLNVAYVMAGYSIELVFKSLAWILGMRIIRTHKIRPFYDKFDADIKRSVDFTITHAGWLSADEFVEYVDGYLDPVKRRYFGINLEKEFQGLNVNIADNKINSLLEVHQRLRELIVSMLE